MTDRGWPDPRQWVGDAPFPWPAPAWLQPGESHTACYTVLSVGQTRDANGQAVLEVELSDARGSITGLLPADPAVDWVRPGLYVGVRATVVDAGGWTLLDIADVSPVRVELDDLALFLPHSSADPDALEAELARLIGSVTHAGLRALLELMLNHDTEIGRGFRLAPAATRNHHACLGGLFEHTVSVARLCDFAADHYGDTVDRNLLVAGALLHDIGKIREIGARAGFPYTDEGRLLGHILLGLRMAGDAARDIGLEPETRLLLEHLIASHQGRYEWQSPREPMIIEAFILHHIDNLDAKVDHARSVIDTVDAGWTDYDRSFRRELLQHSPTTPAARARQHDAADFAERAPATAAESAAAAAPASGPAPVAATAGDDTPRQSPGSGSRKPARKRSARKKATPRRRKATRKKSTKKSAGRRTSRRTTSRKPGTEKRTGDAADPPEPAARHVGRPAIVEPGMPGFVDTDTLDLFEQE